MNREQATSAIREARLSRKITWKSLAETVGRSPAWTTAALLGQHTMSEEEASAAVTLLQLDKEVCEALQQIPHRGAALPVPTDPTIYRFHELVQVYGDTLKELIHEEFGDGIMSAIDFEIGMERKEDPKGDRVIITLNGKFLPYRKF